MKPAKRNSKAGISLIEVIAVMAVISVLIAIAAPVFQSVKRGAIISSSINKMHQWTTALQLYCADFGDTGGTSGLGLPNSLGQLGDYSRFKKDMYETGGVKLDGASVYVYAPPSSTSLEQLIQRWRKHVTNTGGNPVCLIDATQDPEVRTRFDRFSPITGLGAFLDGSVKKKRKRGGVTSYEDWQ